MIMRFVFAATIAVVAGSPAFAAADRFQIQPAEGGFLRLDRETGATAFCAPTGDGYACRPTAESATAPASEEVARLRKKIEELESRLSTAQAAPGLPPVPSLPDDKDDPKAKDPTLGFPTDQQMDRVTTFVERAIKKLRGLVEEMQREDAPKGERI